VKKFNDSELLSLPKVISAAKSGLKKDLFFHPIIKAISVFGEQTKQKIRIKERN